jgi:hypothetical protein
MSSAEHPSDKRPEDERPRSTPLRGRRGLALILAAFVVALVVIFLIAWLGSYVGR